MRIAWQYHETLNPLVRADESFLCHVLCVFMISEKAIGHVVNPILIAVDKFIECGCISVLALFDKTEVGPVFGFFQ